MNARADPTQGKQAVVDGVGRDMHYGRSIYALQLACFEIGDDLPHAVYAAAQTASKYCAANSGNIVQTM
ncbi:MAG: hypothetical protein WBZ35_08590, partial [Pseudolabrys sp.]